MKLLTTTRPRRCRAGCGRRLNAQNGPGFCGRCRGRHRCKVCGLIGLCVVSLLCPECIRVLERLEEVHESGQDCDRRLWTKAALAAQERRILALAKRADVGLPLFPGRRPRTTLPIHVLPLAERSA